MERYIHIIISAFLILAACAKTEVNSDRLSEIAFSPVPEGMTKAAVEGEEYSDALNFNVFASAEGAPYFNNIPFVAGTETTSAGLRIYEGDPTQYWPRTKQLSFAGYTGDSKDNAAMNADFTALSITGYEQNIENDLMWFFIGPVDNTQEVISPTMHHACSWITIKILGESACGSWPINSITLDGVQMKGDVSFDSAQVEWDNLTSGQSVAIYDGGETIAAAPVAHAIVIPQAPAALTVNYKSTPVDKGGISLKYNGDADWEAGVHYTYTLNFKNPYKIDFSVDTVTPWSEVTPDISVE